MITSRSPNDDSNKTAEEPPPPPNRSIYPLVTQPGYRITVVPYHLLWPSQFKQIASQLRHIFERASPPAHHSAIEHIGSTSVPGLAAKPNIDIMVTFACRLELERAVDALNWEVPTTPPFIRYTQIPGGGGILGRESFKLYVPKWSPYYTTTVERSVYLIDDSAENRVGALMIAGYRAVRDTLRDPSNMDVLQEYAAVKMGLSRQIFGKSTTYATLKDDVIRKILLRAGWTDSEVDMKEDLRKIEKYEDDVPY